MNEAKPDQRFDSNNSSKGMTLVEIVIVLVIIGIIAGISMRSIGRISENSRFHEALEEMEFLANAIVGNPSIIQNDIRIDFGFVGDTGVMPDSLDQLISNAAGISGWDGPYLELGFEADPDHYKYDPWGNVYNYEITGSGKPQITTVADGDSMTRDIANHVDDVINNSVRIRPYDVDGNMINGSNGDVEIKYSGSWNTLTYNNPKQYFEISTVPIGLHQVRVISAGDTVYKSFSITPATDMNVPDQMTVYPEYGTLSYVASSYSISTNELSFVINNSGGPTYNINRVKVDLTGLTNNCLNCELPYLKEFSATPTTYWLYNTNGRSALVPNGAWISLDNTLKFFTGDKSIGPIVFEDASDGAGNPIDLQGLHVTVDFHPLSGSNQQITFNTSGSCLPTSLSYISLDDQIAPTISFTIRNSGDFDAQINSMSIYTDNVNDTYLEQVEIATGTAVWAVGAGTCPSARPYLSLSTANITICDNLPALAGGDSNTQITFTLYGAATGTTSVGSLSGVTFNITFMVECGSNQVIQFTIP